MLSWTRSSPSQPLIQAHPSPFFTKCYSGRHSGQIRSRIEPNQCVCVCVCVFLYVFACMCIHTCMCVCVCVCVCAWMYEYAYISICMCVCQCVYDSLSYSCLNAYFGLVLSYSLYPPLPLFLHTYIPLTILPSPLLSPSSVS